MTPTQKTLIKQSWLKVLPISEQAAALFYERLFTIDPETKPLFANSDMAEQGAKLMKSINLVVDSLDNLEALVPAIQEMGVRHAGYGVKDADYDTVGAALLWTLEQGLGEDFTDETKNAWATAYGLLADTMKSAAAEAKQVA
ncbi:MAG: globin family protein [Gammaproteobacteria bacterium]